MEAFPINHENKYIEFHSSLNENWLNIRIQDNGIGMPPQIYEHLFEIFQTHGKSKGTGLGLYNCKKIITAMNGTIECLTKQNDGTSFTIQIPIIANT
jgi:signal transduction histidine kinase